MKFPSAGFRFRIAAAVLAFTFFSVVNCFAADWVVGARKFTFAQYDIATDALDGIATLMPQLILEQIETGGKRIPSRNEIVNRQLSDLHTERLSLFLQLSKEIKSRDNLLLTEKDETVYRTKLSEAEEKINSVKKQIDENLLLTEKLKKETYRLSNNLPAETESEQPEKTETVQSEFQKNFSAFTNLFTQKTETESEKLPDPETIQIYKNDSSSLFTIDEYTLEAGMQSREVEKVVMSAGINGLLNGSIMKYGDYIAVTVELLIYPGAVSGGVITDVGTMSDCIQVAQNLAQLLAPKIYTNLPVELYFNIEPKEARKTARLTVDGLVYTSIPEYITMRSGIHSIDIESKGFNSQTITYDFEGEPKYLLECTMTEQNDGTLKLTFLQPFAGSFFVNGKTTGSDKIGQIKTEVKVNSQPVIGHFLSTARSVKLVEKTVTDENGIQRKEFVQEDGPRIGSFFYIPEGLALPGNLLAADVKPVDNAFEIDVHRKKMYEWYSYTIVSLIPTFIAVGNSKAMEKVLYKDSGFLGFHDAANKSALPDDRWNALNTEYKDWTKFKWTSVALSLTAAGFFVYNLIKYFKAAERVIPVTAVPATQMQFIEAESKLEEYNRMLSEMEKNIADEKLNDESENEKSQDEILPDENILKINEEEILRNQISDEEKEKLNVTEYEGQISREEQASDAGNEIKLDVTPVNENGE